MEIICSWTFLFFDISIILLILKLYNSFNFISETLSSSKMELRAAIALIFAVFIIVTGVLAEDESGRGEFI